MDTQDLGASLTSLGQSDQPKSGTAMLGPDVPEQADEQNPLLQLQMTEEEANGWWKRIDDSDTRIKKESEAWKILIDAYLPKVKAGAEEVSANSHFRNIHTKLGQLFVDVPEVQMEPAPASPADNQMVSPQGIPVTMDDIVSVKQTYLNKKLGRDGIKVNRLFDALLMSMLGSAGMGCSKLGYRAVTKKVAKPVMGPDPTWTPPPPPMGTVLGLQPTPQPPQVPQVGPDGQPKTQMVDVVVYEEVYWREFSPFKLVTDLMTTSTRHDEDAAFLGMHFAMTPSQAAGAFGMDEADLKGGKDERKYKEHNANDEITVVTGVELWAKACYFIPGEVHPFKLVQIVFLDNIKDKPVVYRFCQDQTFTEDGELTDDSLDRFPIRVCTIRDSFDSQFPASDSAFTNNLAKQLNTNRRQGVALRDAAIGKVLYDSGALEDGDVKKVQNAKPGDWIAVGEGKLDKGVQSVAAPVAQPSRTNDDYRLDAMLQQNMDETLGISANASGATEDTVRSATEIQTVQRAVSGRNKKERDRVIDHFLDGVRLIDILIMRYTTTQQWAKITGMDGMSRMQAWNGQMVSGRWLYDITVDSRLEMDTAVSEQQDLTLYNLTARDPLVNRVPVLRRLFRKHGYDPTKCVMTPQQTMMTTQPPHGGSGDAVNDHEAAKTGGKENAPDAAPPK